MSYTFSGKRRPSCSRRSVPISNTAAMGRARMIVGVCRISLLIHGNRSLKDKRQVIKSLIEKVRGRFNVSIAETGSNDLLQRAEIGICAVGNDGAFVNSVMDKAVDFIEGLHTAEIIDNSIELINL